MKVVTMDLLCMIVAMCGSVAAGQCPYCCVVPFPDRRPDALTEPVVLPTLETVLLCLLVHHLHSFQAGYCGTPRGAKGSLGRRNAHGLSCRVCLSLPAWPSAL